MEEAVFGVLAWFDDWVVMGGRDAFGVALQQLVYFVFVNPRGSSGQVCFG